MRVRTRFNIRRLSMLALLLSPAILLILVAVITVRQSDPTVPSLFAQVAVAGMVTFLLVLILRYLLLIFLAHRHHGTSIQKRSVPSFDAAVHSSLAEDLPGVTILVPAYNEGVVIKASVSSLLELEYPRLQIMVIDDGSSDDTYDRACELAGRYNGKTVTVVRQENAGKAAALNTGIKQAEYDFLLCIDADSRIEPKTLLYAIRHFEDKDVLAVAGNVKVVNRGLFLTSLQSLEYIQGLNLVRRAQGLLGIVNIIPGPCGLFRKSAVMAVGGYDHDTFAEDCDLTIKLLGLEGRIVYEPHAVAWTEAPEDWDGFIRQRYRWSRGILQSLRKHSNLMFGGSSIRTRITLWYMVFEAIIWPGMNIFALFFFLYLVFFFNLRRYIVLWWLQLTVLDLTAAVFCLLLEERERLEQALWSIPYRFVFVVATDVFKLLSTIEELFRVEMSWGKLDRAGRI